MSVTDTRRPSLTDRVRPPDVPLELWERMPWPRQEVLSKAWRARMYRPPAPHPGFHPGPDGTWTKEQMLAANRICDKMVRAGHGREIPPNVWAARKSYLAAKHLRRPKRQVPPDRMAAVQVMAGDGVSLSAAAESLGIKPDSLASCLNRDPEGKEVLRLLRENAGRVVEWKNRSGD